MEYVHSAMYLVQAKSYVIGKNENKIKNKLTTKQGTDALMIW